MTKFLAAAKKFLQQEEGPTMTEYAIMIALIAIVSIAIVTLLGTEVSSVFSTVYHSLTKVT